MGGHDGLLESAHDLEIYILFLIELIYIYCQHVKNLTGHTQWSCFMGIIIGFVLNWKIENFSIRI